MKILVVGAGAVGGYFGARLAEAGRDVTFLVRPARTQQLQRDGLRILSPHGDLTIKPQTVTSDQILSPYDVILLSVKSFALDRAIADMVPAVGPETMVYPVLNGMRHIDILSRRFGPAPVLGGVCLVSTDVDQQGRIVQMMEMQKLVYGELDGQRTQRIQQLDNTFRNAGFDTEISTGIVQAMWQKWVFIATSGLVTCLFNGPIGQINAVPDGEEASLQALDECAAIAGACGHAPAEPFLADVRKRLTAKGSPFTSSMYRDMQKGTKIEVDTILGDLLNYGRAHNLQTPLLQAACVRMRVYQNTLSA